MFMLYSPGLNTVGQCSADVAEYICSTAEPITCGPSVCLWMVPGTFNEED